MIDQCCLLSFMTEKTYEELGVAYLYQKILQCYLMLQYKLILWLLFYNMFKYMDNLWIEMSFLFHLRSAVHFFPWIEHFLACERHTYFLYWNFRMAKRQFFSLLDSIYFQCYTFDRWCTGEYKTIKFYRFSLCRSLLWPSGLLTWQHYFSDSWNIIEILHGKCRVQQ